MKLDDYSETADHPLSFVGQVRRETANRVMTDNERRLRDSVGRCETCGGPLRWEQREYGTVDDRGWFNAAVYKCCLWCGLEPTKHEPVPEALGKAPCPECGREFDEKTWTPTGARCHCPCGKHWRYIT